MNWCAHEVSVRQIAMPQTRGLAPAQDVRVSNGSAAERKNRGKRSLSGAAVWATRDIEPHIYKIVEDRRLITSAGDTTKSPKMLNKMATFPPAGE